MKIIVYDDNPDYGGHQTMACHGIESLAEDLSVELLAMINPANSRLAARLDAAGIETRPAQAGWPASRPDLALCIQGDLAQSTKGLKAARAAGIECVSYLALPHTLKEMGAKLGALRDSTNRIDLNLPDRFITISEGMAHKLADRGFTRSIAVVPNGILAPSPSRRQREVGSSPCTLGLAGRIEFKQKQQDFAVHAIQHHSDILQHCQLLIAGSGPDEPALQRMIAGSDRIRLLPWQQDMDDFYEQIDVLIIPSRYEGVPLVMLEALARGIPVAGSAVDGMAELLPQEWTYPPRDANALAQALLAVRNTGRDTIASLQQKVLSDHSLETFKSRFAQAVCGH